MNSEECARLEDLTERFYSRSAAPMASAWFRLLGPRPTVVLARWLPWLGRALDDLLDFYSIVELAYLAGSLRNPPPARGRYRWLAAKRSSTLLEYARREGRPVLPANLCYRLEHRDRSESFNPEDNEGEWSFFDFLGCAERALSNPDLLAFADRAGRKTGRRFLAGLADQRTVSAWLLQPAEHRSSARQARGFFALARLAVSLAKRPRAGAASHELEAGILSFWQPWFGAASRVRAALQEGIEALSRWEPQTSPETARAIQSKYVEGGRAALETLVDEPGVAAAMGKAEAAAREPFMSRLRQAAARLGSILLPSTTILAAALLVVATAYLGVRSLATGLPHVSLLFRDGGPMMWPLLVLAILGLVFIIERFLALRRAKINVNEFLAKARKALIVNRSVRAAIQVCEDYRGPVASILKAGLLKYGQPREDVEKTIENAALYEMGRLEKNLVWLASIANVAPLLGFFGTVAGMFKSFDALAEAGFSNPGLVASGISEALISAAAGLAVAIPAQLAHNFFMSRINEFVRDIETSTNMLLEAFGEMEGDRQPDRDGPSSRAPS